MNITDLLQSLKMKKAAKDVQMTMSAISGEDYHQNELDS